MIGGDPRVVVAAALAVLVGLAHSWLGERYLISRLLRRDDLPRLLGGDWFTRRTLRFAWHLTTVAWWGLAAALVTVDEGPRALLVVVAVTFAVHAVLTLAASHGRHLAWVAFAAIAALCLTVAPPEGRPKEENLMADDLRIDYVELATTDIARSKAFYGAVFGWEMTDWGDAYTSFSDGRLEGGFRLEESVTRGGPLVVVKAADLEAVAAAVERHGGTVVVPIFSFPGGRRFHFTDPVGNELAVWSELADEEE